MKAEFFSIHNVMTVLIMKANVRRIENETVKYEIIYPVRRRVTMLSSLRTFNKLAAILSNESDLHVFVF